MSSAPIRVVLFDLDGVIRHFDPEVVAGIEHAHGLEPGIVERCAFTSPLIDEVTTGRIPRAEWVRRVGTLIGDSDAAEQWGRQPSTVDVDILDLSDGLREMGVRTAVLTNGTDTIPAEMAAQGLSDRFDAVFNSAEIGFAKPDVRAFRSVLDAMDVDGPGVFFTDDSAAKLVGADRLAMTTHLYRGITGLRAALAAADLDVER